MPTPRKPIELVNPRARYKVKEAYTPDLRAPAADWVLKTMEELHEEAWEVVGVSPAGPRAIWIFYRKKGV